MTAGMNLVGERFGMLTVTERAHGKHGGRYWLCRCDCGEEVTVRSGQLLAGRENCGCVARRSRDIGGRRFGRLIALAPADGTNWLCSCDCGNTLIARAGKLRSGHTRSCGCLVKDVAAMMGAATRAHGHASTPNRTPTYRSWMSMKARCANPANRNWPRYGGRGITVCERWQSFENFLTDMGERPEGTSIDRIDGAGNYEPANCRWATPKEQAQGRARPGARTHCKRGHALTEENVSTTSRGTRECRICRNARARMRHREQRRA